MALKIGAALETDLIRLVRSDGTTPTSAQNYLTLNKYARQVWEARANWTIRLNPTQIGLNAQNGAAITTSGTYGNRIESFHGLYLESGATNTVSTSQLERLEASEMRLIRNLGVDGTGPETGTTPIFYSAEPLAADTDTTQANHGLWLVQVAFNDGSTARNYSAKVRLRYAEITSTTYPDWPDSWGDLVVNLSAIELNLLLGHVDLANNIASLLPKDDEQFARRIFESTKPRTGGGEMVAR